MRGLIVTADVLFEARITATLSGRTYFVSGNMTEAYLRIADES